MTGSPAVSIRPAILLAALVAAQTGCFAESHGSGYVPPPDRTTSIPTCPTVSDPAAGVTVDVDVGPKLVAGSGEGVSVEYSSGGLWHVQAACNGMSGYRCEFEVTAEVFQGSVANVTGEELEDGDTVGSSCPDTAFMIVNLGTDLDGMTFTTAPGAKIRVTAALDHAIYADLIYWVQGGALPHDAHSNPLDLTPASP